MSDEHTITGEIRDHVVEITAIKRFSCDMARKLRENSHKAHWNTVTKYYLLGRLQEELYELEEALYSESTESVINECADVANLAMMIADNLRDPEKKENHIVDVKTSERRRQLSLEHARSVNEN